MSDRTVSRETPPPPAGAAEVFSDRLELAARYADWLATEGVVRGLIGPRERGRLWTRHLLNSAVVSEAAGRGASVVDIGSGAGLPGLAWAIRRPDLSLTLVEPMLRRTRFLEEVVADLDLGDAVTVVRARAEDVLPAARFDVVTSRAVAPLKRLVEWSAPLCRAGGRIVALKGRSAAEEIVAADAAIGRVSDVAAELATYGSDVLEEPARAVQIVVDRPSGLAR